jgi:hypothetical protein
MPHIVSPDAAERFFIRRFSHVREHVLQTGPNLKKPWRYTALALFAADPVPNIHQAFLNRLFLCTPIAT